MAGLSSLVPAGTGEERDRPFVLVDGGVHVGTTLAAHHVDSIDAGVFRETNADRAAVAVVASGESLVDGLPKR